MGLCRMSCTRSTADLTFYCTKKDPPFSTPRVRLLSEPIHETHEIQIAIAAIINMSEMLNLNS